MNFSIRHITVEDNKKVKALVLKVLLEHGAEGDGFASADPELECMYETYQKAGASFWIVEQEGDIKGVGGIGPLSGEGKEYCELQKMYFLKELRGLGAGKKLISLSLSFAKEFGYSYCYLETLSNMIAAQNLYKKYNFQYLKTRLGGTGHTSCPIFMLLKFNES